MHFLVIGATGNVGGQAVEQLLDRGHTARALVRNASRAGHLPDRVDVAVGDLDNVESLTAAARGVDAAFFMQVGPDPAQAGNMVQALQAAGVRRLVVLSSMGTIIEPKPMIGAAIAARDAVFDAADLDLTYIKANAFMSNALWWLPSIQAEGKVYDATDPGMTVPIDPYDIARVAVTALVEDAHVGKAYLVNGPEALTARQQVDILAKAVGRPIEFVSVTPEQLADMSIEQGTPPQLAHAVANLNDVFRMGRAGIIAHDVINLTGIAPRTFQQWCQANAEAFR